MPFTGAYGTAPNVVYAPIPLLFTPTQFPGFLDYARTFSQFRLLKARCKVHLALPGDSAEEAVLTNQPFTYLRVPSRPFLEDTATVTGSTAGGGGDPINIQRLIAAKQVTVSEIRQSRWQRQYYPSDIKNSISFKFYPYTLTWSGKPVGTTADPNNQANQYQYLTYMSARRWMPMSFLGQAPEDNPSNARDDVTFFGPYFARLRSTQPDSQALTEFVPIVTISLYVQFRGQK